MIEIKEYKNYSITNDGKVYSKKRNKFLRITYQYKYPSVQLCINGKTTTRSIHRLMALSYLPQIEGKNYVNHINGIKTDNRIENLEWTTPKENTIHAIAKGLYTPPKRNRKDLSKEVFQYDLNGNFISKYLSANEAYRITNISQRHISSCANGGEYRISSGIKKFIKTNSAGGYKWHWQQVKQEIEKL
jgi:hypothetical protein